MAIFNLNSDLFLGSQELNRLLKFIDESGFRKLLLQNSLGFGIVNNSLEGNFTNFKVEQGTNIGTIKIGDGLAIDADGQLITYFETDNIEISNDSQFYWITITHQHDYREQGVCSVDGNGNLSFPGGELLSILRGIPNNPVKVKFTNATSNIREYEVLEVIDDENAVLTGDFSAESNLRLAVVGAFTPDVVPPTASKYPFRYDGCDLQITLETTLNTPPTLIQDYQFTIARVKRTGSAITIQDKRVEIYKDKANFLLSTLSEATNPLIGVEAIKYNDVTTPRDKNLIYATWSFRSSNWTIDSSTNRLTLIAGNGGKFKTTSDFTDGDFDGWRVYTKDGSYSIIKQSSLSATQINLILDTLDVNKYTDTAQQIIIAPNSEEIELIFTPVSGSDQSLTTSIFTFPINNGLVNIPLVAFNSPTCQYTFSYKYKNLGDYKLTTLIPDDSVGYYTEASFDDNGVLVGSARQTYASGIITLVQAGNAYSNVIDSLTTGQVLGVEYVSIDTDADPVTRFVVGTRKEYVVISNDPAITAGDTDFGTAYPLTADTFLDLRTDLPSNLKNGNYFIVQFRGEYTLGAYSFSIVQNYVNSGDTGTLLYELTQADLDFGTLDNLLFRFEFDGTNWFVHKFISADTASVTASRTISTTSPLTGGGDLSANRTLAINDAAADGATKGAAAFAANDFNAASGVISLDYINGQAASAGAKGFLTAADWSTFNSKQSNLGYNFTSLNLGVLDMTTAGITTHDVAHGLDKSKIRMVDIMIYGNDGDVFPFGRYAVYVVGADSTYRTGSSFKIDSTNIHLEWDGVTDPFGNDTNFNGVGSNRGIITIISVP